MHSRTVPNLVLFNQLRQHGVQCEWTGLTKMAVNELVTVCILTKDVVKFKEGFDLLCLDKIDECCEFLTSYGVNQTCRNPSLYPVNDKKCHLLFGLFKKHGLRAFSTLPPLRGLIHETLNTCQVYNYDVHEVACELFEKIVKAYEVYRPHDEYHEVISYLTEQRGVNVNNLPFLTFVKLLEYLQNILLYLCSVFSTPTTNIFLHAKLNAWQIDLLWMGILEHLPRNTCPGSVELIRGFIKRGFVVKQAIFSVDFSKLSFYHYTPEGFNHLVEIFEIFIDHGARLNPTRDDEVPFLAGMLKLYEKIFSETEIIRPKLYGFITKCIERGVDPKSCAFTFIDDLGDVREDLFSAVCDYYDADDKDQLIEYLCNCGADASLSRNNGADLWPRLCRRSPSKCSSPRFNETLLNLLRRGLRTDFVNRYEDNALHMYFNLFSSRSSYRMYCQYGSYCHKQDCCRYGWFRELDDLKFWDVLDALLDAGVHRVNNANGGLETVEEFKRIMPFRYETDLETVCSECCKRYTFVDTAVDPNAQLARVSKIIDRLSPCSPQPT